MRRTRSRYLRAKVIPLLSFSGNLVISVEVIDDEKKVRRMSQHICYWRAARQRRRYDGAEYEVSPPFAKLARVCTTGDPWAHPPPAQDTAVSALAFVKENQPVEIKYVQK